jgi:hypothetical protein
MELGENTERTNLCYLLIPLPDLPAVLRISVNSIKRGSMTVDLITDTLLPLVSVAGWLQLTNC